MHSMELFNGSKESYSYFEHAILHEDTELELIFGSKVSNNPITKKAIFCWFCFFIEKNFFHLYLL